MDNERQIKNTINKLDNAMDREKICLQILEINKSIAEINMMIFKELAKPIFVRKM